MIGEARGAAEVLSQPDHPFGRVFRRIVVPVIAVSRGILIGRLGSLAPYPVVQVPHP